MFQVGDFIIYGDTGVCRVTAIGTPRLASLENSRLYYTLTPAFSSEVIYTPVDTRVFMRPILTREEAGEFIRLIPSLERKIDEEAHNIKSSHSLMDYYQSYFLSHTCEDLICLIKTIYLKNEAARKAGRNPGKIEEKYKKRAEAILYGELAVALHIAREDVSDYIKNALKEEYTVI